MSAEPILNIKPRSTSLSLEVNRTHKSASRILFHDDYSTHNNVEFETNLRGLHNSVQYKSVAEVRVKPEGTSAVLNDEMRLDFGLSNDATVRLKFKPSSLLAHLDFGYSGYATSVGDTNIRAWFNPYVQYQANRLLSNNALFFGLLSNVNSGTVVSNARVKLLTNKDNQIDGEFENNWTFKYNNLLLNWYYIDNLRNVFNRVGRKVTLEYLTRDFSAALELNKHRRGSIADWNMDTLNVGLAYQHNNDLTYGVWSHTELQNNNDTTLAAGLNYRVNREVTVKAKADTKQDVALFANYNVAKGLNLQTSLQSSADAKRIRDVYNNAFKFGLKLKYDN